MITKIDYMEANKVSAKTLKDIEAYWEEYKKIGGTKEMLTSKCIINGEECILEVKLWDGMPTEPTAQTQFYQIVKSLKETGEATHKGLTFELDDITQTCGVYDSNGEYLFFLEHVSEIKEYC